jgi:rhomboid protease GluP
MGERLERARGFFRTVWSHQRMCPACRALVDRKDRVCPLCGERLSSVAGPGLDRMFDLALPDQARWSIILLGINLFLYALTWIASQQARGGAGGNLLGGMDGYTLIRFGARDVYSGAVEWWRFIAPIFLHGNALHLAMNCWVLYDLGPAVEGIYGRQKFLVMYLASGIGGSIASHFWQPRAISIGASGAIFGLIGVMIAYGYRNRSRLGDSVKNMFVRWAVFALIFSFLPGIDMAAHIGGLAGGILLGAVVADTPSLTRPAILLWRALQMLAIAAILTTFLMVGWKGSRAGDSRASVAYNRPRSSSSYTDQVRSAQRSHVNSAARRRPLSPSSRASDSSSATRRMASRMASTLLGSTKTAASPATSGIAETSDVITGRP